MYSPFAENVVSFSAILFFGSSPATFSANHTAFSFIPDPATTRVHRENLRSIGCENALLVLRILVARDDGELEVWSGGLRPGARLLGSGDPGRPESRRQQ